MANNDLTDIIAKTDGWGYTSTGRMVVQGASTSIDSFIELPRDKERLKMELPLNLRKGDS